MEYPENFYPNRSNAIDDQIRFQYYVSVHFAFSNKKPAFWIHKILTFKVGYKSFYIIIKRKCSSKPKGFKSILKDIFQIIGVLLRYNYFEFSCIHLSIFLWCSPNVINGPFSASLTSLANTLSGKCSPGACRFLVSFVSFVLIIVCIRFA